MKKLTLVAGICMLACAFMGCSKKTEKGEFTVQKGKLTIGMEIGYPPFEYYAEDGKTPVGFDVELGTEIAKRLDLDAEFIDTAWDGIFAGLNTERYDVVISAATITPERVENFLFSNPYIGNGQAIIVRKDSNLKIKNWPSVNLKSNPSVDGNTTKSPGLYLSDFPTETIVPVVGLPSINVLLNPITNPD